MGTYTEKLKLYKPDINETGWGNLVNSNFDKIDAIKPDQLGAEPKFAKKAAFNKPFGTTEGTVCQGNDPRLSQAKVVPPHADKTTKYGASSDTLYGHAKASKTVPKAPGTASVGTEVNTFARGDHVHQAQTSISGNAGTATKLANIRNIGLSGGVKSTAQPFDGTKDISIPVSEIKASAITGNLPVASLPAATTTTKGCVIIGDGLEIDAAGVLKVKDSGTTKVYKVYSKGSRTPTDIKLGVLSYNLEPSNKDVISVTSTKTETVTITTGLKYIYTQKAFTKSQTLPTVFEAAEKLITAATKEVTCKLSASSSVGRGICKFSFLKSSDQTVISEQEVAQQTIDYKLTFPAGWDYEKDTFDIKGDIRYEGSPTYPVMVTLQFNIIGEDNIQIYL